MLLVLVGALDVLVYVNFHLYYKAKKLEDNQKKIKILEKASHLYPLNDVVFFEKGRAYFDSAISEMGIKGKSAYYFQKSIADFKQALKRNPASYFAHFNLAKSLLYRSYLFPSNEKEAEAYDEYKKAAELAGENGRIYYEVAVIFLSQWPKLSNQDKEFTEGILKKILKRRKRDEFLSLLQIWEINVKDYALIDKILPEDSQIYREYAKFLGEKSLSLQERQKYLAKAEFLEFKKAKEEFNLGEYEYFYYRRKEAAKHYQACLRFLKNIRFYQNLVAQNLVDFSELNRLKKSAILKLAKSQIDLGKSLKEVEPYLREYINLEDKISAIDELANYLRNKGLIGEELKEFSNDLDLLAFELFLYFRQHRYREIMEMGRIFEKSFIVVPEDKKGAYVQILNIIGDSNQKIDFIYDADQFYHSALDLEPTNLETMLRIKRNYGRMNAEKKIIEIDRKIKNILSPQKIAINKNSRLKKEKDFSITLIFDGQEKILNLRFKNVNKEIPVLLSVVFNEQVIWEE